VRERELHRFEEQLFTFMKGEGSAVLADMLTKKGLDDDITARLQAAIEAFKKMFVHDSIVPLAPLRPSHLIRQPA